MNTSEAEQEKPLPSSPEELRQWEIEDMSTLAAFIEEQLELKDKPSLGVEVSTANLEFQLVEDVAATSNETVNVLLAAEPEAFLNKRTRTSEYDRVLHSWITDEEYGQLYDALHDTRTGRISRCWLVSLNKVFMACLRFSARTPRN